MAASAAQVFTRLTVISAKGIAYSSTRAELVEGKNAAEVLDVEAVLEAFAAERLLILAALEAGRGPPAGVHPADPQLGQDAEVDFGDVYVDLAGVRTLCYAVARRGAE